ncbi:MAG: 7-cyano-7-deazaguanine synthase QueC [Planctomycetota bacterium]|nr:7-cyano-7-deazaguanine synthase QueC [Planctomycetota bacterium]
MSLRDGSAVSSAAVSLLSGGLDSMVATLLWLSHGKVVSLGLTFDYGQRAAQREAAAAARFCEQHRIEHVVIALPFLAQLSLQRGSLLVATDQPLPSGTLAAPGDERSAALVWVPARNAVFLSIAAAHAEVRAAGIVLAGFNREEAATFKDNSPAFVSAASAFFALGTQPSVGVESPTLWMDKREIVRHARRLGLRPEAPWSCYGGGDTPCGRCESCLRSARAWASDDECGH